MGWFIWGLIGIASLGFASWVNSRDKKYMAKKGEVRGTSRSRAFLEGYKDMLSYGLNVNGTIVDGDDYDFKEDNPYSFSYYPDRVLKLYLRHGEPTFESDLMMDLAEGVIDKSRKVNPDKGQMDSRYLGGTEEEFRDYYAGGMKFLADLDSYKGKVYAKKAEEENRKRLIDSRKAGLKEINRKVVLDMEALDELRDSAFDPKKYWDAEMNAIEGKQK